MTARKEIEQRLNNWAKAQVPPIPVSVEGFEFKKPVDGPYLEVFLLGDSNVSANLAAEGVRHYGMFQVNCYYPANNGMGDVEELRDAVVALYPVLPKIGTVSIEKPLSWSGGTVIDGFAFIPIRANYRVES